MRALFPAKENCSRKNLLSRDKFSATGSTENEYENLHRSGLPASSSNGYCEGTAPVESVLPQPQKPDNVDIEGMDCGSQCWPRGANRFHYLGFPRSACRGDLHLI